MSPDRSSTYDLPSGNESNATRPPCFWNCDTDAGDVLKIRHGAFPAVIAAPITSSAPFPPGYRPPDLLLRALPRPDLLRGDLLIRMPGIPRRHHLLAPGHLLGIVRIPDRDRPTRLRRSVGTTRDATASTRCDSSCDSDEGDGGQRAFHGRSRRKMLAASSRRSAVREQC